MIVPIEEYKVYRVVGDTVASRDAAWEAALESAQSMLETFCDRKFDLGDYTQRISGDGSKDIMVRNVPIVSVARVAIVGDDGEETDLEAGAYRADTDGETGIISLVGSRQARGVMDEPGTLGPGPIRWAPCWPEGDKNIIVEYEGGYDEETMPAALQQLVKEMADEILFSAGRPQSLQSESYSGSNYSYSRGGRGTVPDLVGQMTWWQVRALGFRRGGAL